MGNVGLQISRNKVNILCWKSQTIIVVHEFVKALQK